MQDTSSWAVRSDTNPHRAAREAESPKDTCRSSDITPTCAVCTYRKGPVRSHCKIYIIPHIPKQGLVPEFLPFGEGIFPGDRERSGSPRTQNTFYLLLYRISACFQQPASFIRREEAAVGAFSLFCDRTGLPYQSNSGILRCRVKPKMRRQAADYKAAGPSF